MPTISSDATRRSYKIQGLDLTLPSHYSEGHVMSTGDANFANSRLHSVMVNAYGGDVRRAVTALDAKRKADLKAKKYTGPMSEDGKSPAPATVEDLGWDHQAKIDAKFTDYKIGASNARVGTTSDPLEAVARTIAVREVKDQLAAKKLKVKPLMAAKDAEHGSAFNRIVHERLNGRHKERIFALAQAQIDSTADDDEDDIQVPASLREAVAA